MAKIYLPKRTKQQKKGTRDYFNTLTPAEKVIYIDYCQWKVAQKTARYEKWFYQPQMQKREKRFVECLFPRLVTLLMDENVGKKTQGQFQREITGAALSSLNPSGWRAPVFNKDASLNKAALKKVGELIKLPRLQNYLLELFAESGWTLKNGSENLAAIANQELTDKNAATVMRANLEIFKLMFGTLSRNENTNINVDVSDTALVEDWGKTPEPMFDAKVIEASAISHDNSYEDEHDDL